MKKIMTSLLEQWRQVKSRHWTWAVAAILAGFLAFYFDSTSAKPVAIHEPESTESPATMIPAGFVLVPIEVANFESLDSILGKFGVVDLYLPSDDPKKKARKVAHHLRILRAPLNPSRFAVLASEAESPRLVSHPGPFVVVVQNPKHAGTGFVSSDETQPEPPGKSRARRSRIVVEELDEKDN